MFARFLTIVALLVAGIAVLFSSKSRGKSEVVKDDLGPYIQGKNKTVLFLANCEHGLANVHVATAVGLLENYPDIDVHYASFPSVRNKIARVSNYATTRQPTARNITFHELNGPSFEEAFNKLNGDVGTMIHPPGVKGMPRFLEELQQWIAPWDVDTHMSLYNEMGAIIDEVNPAVVVLDTLFRPSFDITRDKNWQHAILTPNTLADNFIGKQPNLGMLWKYPA